MKNKIKYLCILHLVLLIFSITDIASKLASGADFLSSKFCVYYGIVIAGLGIYTLAWQQIIKHLPLVTAYANKAVTVIWGIVWGSLIFKEHISVGKIIGAIIVISGVYLIVTADDIDNENNDKQEKENEAC